MAKVIHENDTNDKESMGPETPVPPRRGGQPGSSLLRGCIWVLAIISISFFSIGVYEHTSPWRQTDLRRQVQGPPPPPPPATWQAALESLMSPDTAESLVTDQQLRRSLGFAVEFTASLTRDLGHKYDLPSLNEVGDKLAKVRRDLENLDKVPLSRKRQLFPGMPSPGSGGGFFSSLLPGGGAGAGAGGGADGEQQTGGLLSQMSSGVISELAKPLKEALSGVKDKLVQNAGGATFFLGVGVGGGTAQGMNLTDGPGTKALMEKVAADNGQTASGLNPAIENLGMGLTATLLGAVDIKELGNKFNITELLGDTPLSDVALSMSEGLGGGAAKGLNLGNGAQLTAPRGSKVRDVVGALGFGLTDSVTSAMSKGGSVTPDITSFNITPILGGQSLTQVAFGLADGLGTGAAKGLKMGNAVNAQPATGTQASDVVNAFGFGLTNSVTRNIDTSKSFDLGSFNVTPFLGGQSLTQVAFGLADGLGTGAAKGLKMGNATTATPPAGNQASDVVGAFGFALTDAVTRNLDTNKTFDLTSSFNISQLLGGQTLAQVARMFADGIGSGATKGLNLGNARVRNVEPPQGTSAADVAGAFGFGLTESLTRSFDGDGAGAGLPMNFDIDGTLQKTFPGLKIGSVVQGFARGFLQGASDSIIMMGGIQAMMNGTAVIPTTFPNETIAFNDTLGGAGTGFGQGLGGQGVIVAAELIAKQFPDALKIPGANNRSIPTRPLFDKADLAPARLARRDGPILAGPGFNLSAIINADTISNGTQTVLDLLQCEGVGGIILIGVGLIRSGAISFNVMDIIKGGNPISKFGLNENVTNTIRQVIPNGTIHFTSRGNFYDIDGTGIKGALDGNMNGAIDGIKINSLKLIPFIVLLIMHILFAIIIFIAMLPLALCLESARNILARMASPYLTLPRKTSKWIGIMYGYVIAPFLVIVFVFGIVVAGSRQDHFRNAHAILGLLSVIFGLPTIALYWTDTRLAVTRARVLSVLARDINTATFRMAMIRAITNQLFQTLAVTTILSGFGQISGVALCATQIVPFEFALSIGFAFASISSIGMMLNWLDFYMAWRISRIPKAMKTPDASGSDTNEGGDEEAVAGRAVSKGKRPVRGDPEKTERPSMAPRESSGIFYPEKSVAPPRLDNSSFFFSEKTARSREDGTFFYPEEKSPTSIGHDDVRSYMTAASPSQPRAAPTGGDQTKETEKTTRSPLPVLKSGTSRNIRELYDNKI
ncbi:hypothetical protein MCOR03_009298 [Pyricularia oryzae]|uniref:Uncharacterized protein n=1 Tax=Pyricularia grisea TaxID=148305 RepID=A0ABQ8NLJ9_PYRGI|nr:hypothetical protein MCOR33_006074 [Pyricularia grisea]KAI6398445.1 hypothetical protein MCOR23_005705 [Pyricularia oryzae]KAI6416514.1 hypothetical protein MCOR20_000985 [Pyricularia oryzae]KAI6550727.1 hypothetical protein MCOR03_009298 [Pyricularia oryzae]KAI6605111.1 hypothetical protein MCOR12_001937 [Pyricularia oryzae]